MISHHCDQSTVVKKRHRLCLYTALQVSAEDSLHDDLSHENGKNIFTVRYSHSKEYVDILT